MSLVNLKITENSYRTGLKLRNSLYTKEKTEFIMFGTSQQLQKMQYSSITVYGEVIEGKGIVRNLGAFFDNEMKMHGHVQHILKCGNYQLRQLGVLRKCLTTKTATTLVVSLFFFQNGLLQRSSLRYFRCSLGQTSKTLKRLCSIRNQTSEI